jgi:hypothetical protein
METTLSETKRQWRQQLVKLSVNGDDAQYYVKSANKIVKIAIVQKVIFKLLEICSVACFANTLSPQKISLRTLNCRETANTLLGTEHSKRRG